MLMSDLLMLRVKFHIKFLNGVCANLIANYFYCSFLAPPFPLLSALNFFFWGGGTGGL